MEEKPAKADSSGDGASAGPQLTMTEDSDNNGRMDESMDMLDAGGDGDPKAYLATGSEPAAKDGCDFTKPPANEKEARARPDWPLWKQAIKEKVTAHQKLGTWSTNKGSNKQNKAVKTRFVFDIKHDAEEQKTRYKARLVAQGFKQVPGRAFDETWAPVPNTATSRTLFAVAAADGWEVHHVDVKTAFLNPKMDKEMYIKLPEGVSRRSLRMCAGSTWPCMGRSKRGGCGASSSTKSSSRWELRGLRWTRAFTSGTTLCTGASSSSCTSTT